MRYAMTALVLFLVMEPTALADDLLEQARQLYDFESWPGKDGVLKQGLALAEVDLTAFEEHSRRNRLTTSGEIIVRYRNKSESNPCLEIGIRVFDSVAGAQEHLLSYLNGSTMVIPTGESLGLAVGDVSFATKDASGFDSVAFTRNNVYVRVSRVYSAAGQASTPADVGDIAGKLDARILVEKQAKKAKHLAKPRIKKFSPAKSVAKPDEPVQLQLSVTDPAGAAVEIHFDEGGGMVYQQDGSWYFQAEKARDYTVTVYALNDRFLMSEKSITIRVLP